jgi:hypothetical protein
MHFNLLLVLYQQEFLEKTYDTFKYSTISEFLRSNCENPWEACQDSSVGTVENQEKSSHKSKRMLPE